MDGHEDRKRADPRQRLTRLAEAGWPGRERLVRPEVVTACDHIEGNVEAVNAVRQAT